MKGVDSFFFLLLQKLLFAVCFVDVLNKSVRKAAQFSTNKREHFDFVSF